MDLIPDLQWAGAIRAHGEHWVARYPHASTASTDCAAYVLPVRVCLVRLLGSHHEYLEIAHLASHGACVEEQRDGKYQRLRKLHSGLAPRGVASDYTSSSEKFK